MNDYINNLLNDLYIFVDNLIELSVIDKSFNKKNISIDYFSNSKKGDVSSNLYIILNKNKIDTNFDLYDFLLNKINSLDYIKDVNISKSGFINFFYNSDYIFNNLNYILKENLNSLDSVKNLLKRYKNNINLIAGDTNTVLHKIDLKNIDFAFIDGGHSYETVMNDLTILYQNLKGKNKVLLCDDYGKASHIPEVERAVNDFSKKRSLHINVIEDRFAEIII